MRLRLYLIILAALSFACPVRSQEEPRDISGVLEDLYFWIVNSSSDNEKLRLNDSVMLLVDSYVRSDTVMKHRFNNVRNLGQIDSPDGKLKIINWNLALRDGSNRYYLYIIRAGKKNSANRIYKLTGTNSLKPIRKDAVYDTLNWYGAVYYAIQPFKAEKETSYILLGIDLGDTYNSRKIIDVLNFSKSGEITFGRKCFLRDKDNIYREVIEYSSEGVVTLRIESKKLIVFDHLDIFSAGHENSASDIGAGLFFDGYILKKGYWNYVSNIEVKNKKH